MAVTASDAEKARYYEGSAELLASAHAVKSEYRRGKVVEGTIASANFWNSEVDRINWFHNTFGKVSPPEAIDLCGARHYNHRPVEMILLV